MAVADVINKLILYIISDPPDIEVQSEHIYTSLNKEVQITCKVKGNPTSKVN